MMSVEEWENQVMLWCFGVMCNDGIDRYVRGILVFRCVRERKKMQRNALLL